MLEHAYANRSTWAISVKTEIVQTTVPTTSSAMQTPRVLVGVGVDLGVENYPENYCECHPLSRRGGDDCSKLYCLNECSETGTCKDGVCSCDELHHGPDCSILEIPLYLE